MHKIFFLIGASGSGKTTAARSIEKMKLPHLAVCYSDSLPVPSTAEMVRQYGSQEEWQKANTILWVGKMKKEFLAENDVIFDVQTRPLFIKEACEQNGIRSYEAVLFDCADEERKKRLIARGQPELAHEDMMNWAAYLRKACVGKGYSVIDNTALAPEQSLARLLGIVGRVLKY